jgi:hypothetical protein
MDVRQAIMQAMQVWQMQLRQVQAVAAGAAGCLLRTAAPQMEVGRLGAAAQDGHEHD